MRKLMRKGGKNKFIVFKIVGGVCYQRICAGHSISRRSEKEGVLSWTKG